MIFEPRELSFIQLRILGKFIQNEELSYSSAKPDGVDNDLFKYHLGFLVEKEIVRKEGDKYSLTDYGKYLTQKLDVFGNPKAFFKASVLSYVAQNGQLLMQKRLRHPYYGDSETVSGKILPGELPEVAANRKLKEETGLEADFKFIGVVRKIRSIVDGDLFEDTLYHVCFGANPKGELVEKNEYGENFWMDFAEAKELAKKNVTYGQYTEEVIDRLKKNDTTPFYFVEKLVIKNP